MQEQVWSKMFLKLALSCFHVWATELASKHKGLAKFKDKFEVLRSARVEFPESKTLYSEGLQYILGSLKELEISRCDFTADFSDMPSRIEASSLNISVHKYDDILPPPDHSKEGHSKSQRSNTALNDNKNVNRPFKDESIGSSKKRGDRFAVDMEIEEVQSNQEQSEIVQDEEDDNQHWPSKLPLN